MPSTCARQGTRVDRTSIPWHVTCVGALPRQGTAGHWQGMPSVPGQGIAGHRQGMPSAPRQGTAGHRQGMPSVPKQGTAGHWQGRPSAFGHCQGRALQGIAKVGHLLPGTAKAGRQELVQHPARPARHRPVPSSTAGARAPSAHSVLLKPLIHRSVSSCPPVFHTHTQTHTHIHTAPGRSWWCAPGRAARTARRTRPCC